MSETQTEPHAFLRNLTKQIEGPYSDFPSSDDFQKLRVEVFQVPIVPEPYGSIQFTPCFFRPNPDKLFEKYPIHHTVEREACLRSLPRARTLQDFIDDALLEHSPAFAPIIAKQEFLALHRDGCVGDMDIDFKLEFDTFSQTFEVYSVIDNLMGVEREGPSDDEFRLDNLRYPMQRPWHAHLYLQPPSSDAQQWSIRQQFKYTGHPHSIESCLSEVCVIDTNQGLTIHELKAIVGVMNWRVDRNCTKKYRIHPVLLLSYLGNLMGRIIQASYDGNGLIIQYSPLWRFEEADTGLLELFARYSLSEPVETSINLPLR